MYETLQSIVDQLDFCGYKTEDGIHDLKMNAAFIALKEKAVAENCGNKTGTTPNKPSDASSCKIKYCYECGLDISHEPARVG